MFEISTNAAALRVHACVCARKAGGEGLTCLLDTHGYYVVLSTWYLTNPNRNHPPPFQLLARFARIFCGWLKAPSPNKAYFASHPKQWLGDWRWEMEDGGKGEKRPSKSVTIAPLQCMLIAHNPQL